LIAPLHHHDERRAAEARHCEERAGVRSDRDLPSVSYGSHTALISNARGINGVSADRPSRNSHCKRVAHSPNHGR
jgi:hypothetical protein